MKLNLLPQTVSKGRALRSGYIIGALILVASLIACGLMYFGPQGALREAQTNVDNSAQPAADAVATGAEKDTVISTAAIVIRNANLAQAMLDHNKVYPDLYDEVRTYVPNFYRLTAMSAQPVDGQTATITLQGTLETYQQYADLMLAMMRWKDVTSVSRTGFTLDLPQVPALSASDQKGIPHKLNEPTLPVDQLQRLAFYESNNYQPAGYLGYNGYGTGALGTKGPTPKESLITLVLTVKKNLQVPDISATLHASGGAAAATPAGFGGPPAGPGMGGPMGPPGGFPGGGPPGVPGGPSRAGGGAAGN